MGTSVYSYINVPRCHAAIAASSGRAPTGRAAGRKAWECMQRIAKVYKDCSTWTNIWIKHDQTLQEFVDESAVNASSRAASSVESAQVVCGHCANVSSYCFFYTYSPLHLSLTRNKLDNLDRRKLLLAHGNWLPEVWAQPGFRISQALVVFWDIVLFARGRMIVKEV